MGSCVSKPAPSSGPKGGRKVGTQTSSNRATAQGRRPTANITVPKPKPAKTAEPFSGPGRLLSTSGGNENVNSTEASVSESPREAAARAAEARLQAAKAKHGTGKLGKKLEEDRQKNRTTLLNEAAAQKEQDKQQPLVFD